MAGWFPLLLCSNRRSGNNYVVHMQDIPNRGAGYGGNISITNWDMEILYQENLMNRNRWSRRNGDLDLVRYLGCSFRFYRDETTDFIASYSLESPMTTNQFSHLKAHPQIQLLKRRHIIIPSFKTKPRGRRWITVKIKPPRLMRNQWYFQRHFCMVKLVQLTVSGMNLRRPWLRKGTETPIVEFRVLNPSLYTNISITNESKKLEVWQKVFTAPYNMNNQWRTILREMAGKNEAEYKDKPLKEVLIMLQNLSNVNKEYEKRLTKLKTLSSNSNFTTVATSMPDNHYLDRVYGMYSYIVLNPETRYDHIMKTAYTTVRYNPIIDKGQGNMVWADPLTKDDYLLDKTKSRVLLSDQPLWLLLYGYCDWLRKYYPSAGMGTNYRILIRCQYTHPPLYSKSNPPQGYVILGDDFCQGRHPNRQTIISPDWETRWYPMMFNQEPAIENIVNCGPWMPRDDESNSWQLNLGYKFYFKLGGMLPPGQPPDDPCTRPTHDLPESNILNLAVQASDPRTADTPFHSWDIRRGLFSARSVKRVREYSDDDENFAEPAERDVQYDPPPEGVPRETFASGSAQLLRALLQTPETPPKRPRLQEEAESEEEEAEVHQLLQRELLKQRQQQQQLKRGIQEMFRSLQLTQLGHHIDARLL